MKMITFTLTVLMALAHAQTLTRNGGCLKFDFRKYNETTGVVPATLDQCIVSGANPEFTYTPQFIEVSLVNAQGVVIRTRTAFRLHSDVAKNFCLTWVGRIEVQFQNCRSIDAYSPQSLLGSQSLDHGKLTFPANVSLYTEHHWLRAKQMFFLDSGNQLRQFPGKNNTRIVVA